MVSAVKWEQDGAGNVTELESSGSLLADNTIVAASTVNAGHTGLDLFGWIEFVGTWSVAPDDTVPTLNLYKSESPDGTNYSSDPVTGGTDCTDQFLIAIPIRKVTSAQRKVVQLDSPIPAWQLKIWVDNQTGQSLNSTWGLKLFKNNPESQ